ncbi:MAG: ABC transporter permease [Candidatus Lokiarchaeota archaeon]|nr:ABC transporter permease [Candidatus Lokiarchaeota archaeon]
MLIILAIIEMVISHLVLNFNNFIKVIADEYVLYTIILTFYASFVATIITIIFGTPLSYLLAQFKFRGKSIINSILNIPIMIPHSVAGLIIFSLFYRGGLIGAPLKELGILFEENINGIIVALLFVSMPIYINTVRDGFKMINPHYSKIGKSLGANERKIFTKIMLPLNKRHIITGSVMCWARGISEFGAVILIAYYPMIAPVLVYFLFNTQGLAGSGPVALLLILLCFFIFIIIHYLTGVKDLELR